VLIIDDDANTRDLAVRNLSREGINAVAAGTDEEGLRRARELQPQIILLDVLMPGMDGWAVLGALKAGPQLSSIPVVMVAMIDQQDLAYVLGAADYIVKPIDREQLRRLLQV
jgi:CheY-like chemotaxis protein